MDTIVGGRVERVPHPIQACSGLLSESWSMARSGPSEDSIWPEDVFDNLLQ
jgi:hypothetical protein